MRDWFTKDDGPSFTWLASVAVQQIRDKRARELRRGRPRTRIDIDARHKWRKIMADQRRVADRLYGGQLLG